MNQAIFFHLLTTVLNSDRGTNCFKALADWQRPICKFRVGKTDALTKCIPASKRRPAQLLGFVIPELASVSRVGHPVHEATSPSGHYYNLYFSPSNINWELYTKTLSCGHMINSCALRSSVQLRRVSGRGRRRRVAARTNAFKVSPVGGRISAAFTRRARRTPVRGARVAGRADAGLGCCGERMQPRAQREVPAAFELTAQAPA